ncbi:MAG: GNAT family protein [Flavobacteriaceae bacterium]
MNFNFETNYLLENERVLLRPLTLDDFQALLPFAQKEPELWTFSLISGAGAENLKSYIEFAISKRKQEDSFAFIVFDKKTQKIAGSTRFYDIQKQHNTLQLGYTWYGKEFQGTGLNKHCKFLLLQFAFETVKVERVEFRADFNNKKSIAAMQSIGCTIEGVLRSNCQGLDGRRDSIVLSILKDEWFTKVKDLLKEKLN